MRQPLFLRTFIDPCCHFVQAGFGFFHIEGLTKDAVPPGSFGFIEQLVGLGEHRPQRNGSFTVSPGITAADGGMALHALEGLLTQLILEGFDIMLEAVMGHKGDNEKFVAAIAVDAGIAKVLLKEPADNG